MSQPKKDIQPTDKNSVFETVKTILVAGVIALTIRSLAYEPFSIPSGSMIPSLLVNDFLFVSKYSYGYSKYSFPLGIFPIDGRIGGHPPERGDVIVFRKPHNEDIDYIKRLIGLPGDSIQVKLGRLYINGKQIQRDYIGDYSAKMPDGSMVEHKRYKETLPNGVVHEIIERSDEGPLDNTDVYHVPEGHYFMMGDNRDGSQDSRVMEQVGYVPAINLVGHAQRIFFSLDDEVHPWEIWQWPTAIRYDRIFKKIQ
jgi:signal peptidase I